MPDPIAMEEHLFSRDIEASDSVSVRRTWSVFNESDEAVVETYVANNVPEIYRGLPRRSISLKRQGVSLFQVDAEYRVESTQANQSRPELNEFNTVLAFNTTGGTINVTTAIKTTSYVAPPRSIIDVKNTIGLDLETGQVRGIDIFAPVYDFGLTQQVANSVVTAAYIRSLRELTGTVNDGPINIGYSGIQDIAQEAEVLFKGARGSRRGRDLWEISYEFAYQKSQTNLKVGDITVAIKRGWDVVDTLHMESTAANSQIDGKPVKVPAQVNIHEVYEREDFSRLLLGM